MSDFTLTVSPKMLETMRKISDKRAEAEASHNISGPDLFINELLHCLTDDGVIELVVNNFDDEDETGDGFEFGKV